MWLRIIREYGEASTASDEDADDILMPECFLEDRKGVRLSHHRLLGEAEVLLFLSSSPPGKNF